MKRRLLYGLLLCSVLVWNASGQPPLEKPKEKAVEKLKELPVQPKSLSVKPKELPVKPKSLSVEEIILRASLSDPEVRIAEAEYQLTKAKLDGLRQNAVKKLTKQRAELDESIAHARQLTQVLLRQEQHLAVATEELKRVDKLIKEGVAARSEFSMAQNVLAASRTAFEQARMNLEGAQANSERLERAFRRVLDSIPGPAKPAPEKKGQLAPPLSIEDLIQQASATDQDVKIGQAEVQLSQAKVYAAQVAAVQKLSAQYAAIEATEAEISAVKEQLKSKSEIIQSSRENSEIIKNIKGTPRVEINNALVAVAQAEGERVAIVAKLMTLESKLNSLKADWKRVEGRAMSVPSGPGIEISWLESDKVWRASESETGKIKLMEEVLRLREQEAMNREQASVLRRFLEEKLAASKPSVEAAPGSPIEKLKQGLGRKISFEKSETTWGGFTQELLERSKINVVLRYDPDENLPKTSELKVSIPAAELTVYEWLQFLADTIITAEGVRGYDFYVRDYGLALMPTSKAPKTALLLSDFWKQIEAEKKPAPPSPEKKPAPEKK
jgi:hypothetical protein